jgi:hypothetical protein
MDVNLQGNDVSLRVGTLTLLMTKQAFVNCRRKGCQWRRQQSMAQWLSPSESNVTGEGTVTSGWLWETWLGGGAEVMPREAGTGRCGPHQRVAR